MQMNLESILDNIHPLPETSKKLLAEYVFEINRPKRYILLRANRVENKLYFIKKGVVRAYAITAEGETTFWFGVEGEAVISMKSYILSQSGYEDIELLEDCVLYEIDLTNLKTLYTKDIHIANWGRKLAEQELLKTEDRLINQQFLTATERYEAFISNRPDIIKRVQLTYVASYLGMSAVSLSRIRAGVK